MKNLLFLDTNWSYAEPEADYFRSGAFLATAGSVAFVAWMWVGQSVASGQIEATYGLVMIGLIGAAIWAIFRLYRSHYLYAVGIFLVTQVIFIAIMIGLLQDMTLGYLYLFTIVMAGSLINGVGSFGIASAAGIIEWVLVNFISMNLKSAELLPVLILLQYLAALVTAQAAYGLYAALKASEVSAQEARKHAQEAREHRGELHRTLKSLDITYTQLQKANVELLQARETADAALKFKKEFTAQTSHELRTPLNLIIGFSQTMAFSQNSYGVKLPPAYLRDVTEIHRNSQHLLSLIDDILDLSKLESGRMGLHFNVVNINDVLQEVFEMIQPLTQAKGLDLIFEIPDSPLELWLDRDRIHQVLLNLLSNAARLTKRGQIVLQATLRKKENEMLIQVKDSGPGISDEMLTRIFEDYQQVEDTSGVAGTSGLGLAISKRIVELHGGHIWAESEIGTGSSFFFVLPVHQSVGQQAWQTHDTTSDAQNRVTQPALVVIGEDGSDEVKLLQRHLEGYSLVSTLSWKNARLLVENMQARVIIASEPIGSAYRAAKTTVPIITCPLPSSRETAHALGSAAYLRKPLTIKALQAALRKTAPNAESLLIIDDDPSTLRLIERMVQGGERTYKIFRAYDIHEGLARVQAQIPDAILLDLSMADDDSLALIKKLKNTPETAYTPIIAISGREIDETVPDQPITIYSPNGFTSTEILKYLQAILSVVPAAKAERDTNVPLSPVNRPE
jgi:signal transduction histidine kinase/CheY-like chemotaxis protein